jgi:multiple antibiotic resistance protein
MPWRIAHLIWSEFALAFSALLPIVNPIGSALLFLGIVGTADPEVYRSLARRIFLNTILFFAVIDLVGSAILTFFGISLPIVQVSGGLVVAAMAWSLLNRSDDQGGDDKRQAAQAATEVRQVSGSLRDKTFYPLTFPITAGPGCIVLMLTLSAHVRQPTIAQTLFAQTGLMLAVVLLSATCYFCYAYAPRLTASISPSTAHGILRVIAFILLCIGVQIAWNGFSGLFRTLLPA